jgi:hypothetical protein
MTLLAEGEGGSDGTLYTLLRFDFRLAMVTRCGGLADLARAPTAKRQLHRGSLPRVAEISSAVCQGRFGYRQRFPTGSIRPRIQGEA